MSSRHSDEGPLARDAADELLDKLLEDADADLHAAIDNVVDLNSGLVRIVGSDRMARTSGSERPTIRACSVVKPGGRTGFRSALSRCWAALLLVGDMLLRISMGRGVPLAKPVLSHHDHQFFIRMVTTEYSVAHRESLTEVYHRIDLLIGGLGGIHGLADNPQQQDVVHLCAGRLASFRKGLENGEISRDEANEIISGVQLTFRNMFGRRRVGYAWIPNAIASLLVSSLVPLAEMERWTISAYVMGALGFMLSISFWLSLEGTVYGSKRRMQIMNIDGELTGLRRVVHRLFDDADDLDFDRSNLPC
jgi:hypothetical protein